MTTGTTMVRPPSFGSGADTDIATYLSSIAIESYRTRGARSRICLKTLTPLSDDFCYTLVGRLCEAFGFSGDPPYTLSHHIDDREKLVRALVRIMKIAELQLEEDPDSPYHYVPPREDPARKQGRDDGEPHQELPEEPSPLRYWYSTCADEDDASASQSDIESYREQEN